MVSKFNHWIFICLLSCSTPSLFAQADSMDYLQVYIGASLSKPLDFFYPGLEITSTIFADKYSSFGAYANYYVSNNNIEGTIKEQGGTLGIIGKIYFNDGVRRRRNGRRTAVGFRQTYIFTKVTGEREYWRQNRSFIQFIDVDMNVYRAATYLTFGRKYNLRPTVNLYWDVGYGLKYVLKRSQNIPDDAEITNRSSQWYNRTLLHNNTFRTAFLSFNVEFMINGKRHHR